MNPIMATVAELIKAQDEANKLTRLHDLLAEIGIQAELRDNYSALMVHRPKPGMPVWVFVGYGGGYYSWDNANKRHPVDDPAGAARELAEYVRRP
ncbi:hypothetical protein AB0F17_31890 [Nonomuraea sp. NPDC026600]|uniref:hypothetical protein n=1 Tax=Nonomuraea sp. NPDC026600 TaxID=3155363 RepID=UPI0033FFDB5D